MKAETKKSEWWAIVENCDHDWEVFNTRIPFLCDDNTNVIEQIRCHKCGGHMERQSDRKVWDVICSTTAK